MIDNIDPIVIDKNGVSVGGHVLRGAVRWTCRQDYERLLFEVQLTLVTSNFHVDLGPGSNGMLIGCAPKAAADAPITAAYEAVGPIAVSKSVSREDGSVETKHFGAGGAQ